MEQAVIMGAEPARLSTYSAEASDLARTLFAILVALCSQGRAVNVVVNVDGEHGTAARWRLQREHEPRLPGRHANMLSGLITPDWANCEGDTFREPFLEWAVTVQRGDTLGDSSRVAVVSRHSPQELRAALWSHITTIGSDCQRSRTLVNDFLTSGLDCNSAGLERT